MGSSLVGQVFPLRSTLPRGEVNDHPTDGQTSRLSQQVQTLFTGGSRS
jgi:hypothetical protein